MIVIPFLTLAALLLGSFTSDGLTTHIENLQRRKGHDLCSMACVTHYSRYVRALICHDWKSTKQMLSAREDDDASL